MASDVEEFVRYQVANAALRDYPFPHFYVRPVLPEDAYRELLRRLPHNELLTPIHESGNVGVRDATGKVHAQYEARHLADISVLAKDEAARGDGTLWHELSSWLLGETFRDLIMQKFAAAIEERFGRNVRLVTQTDARFVRDFTSYRIMPHTDTPAKLVSLLFYLPADESLRLLGTTMYRPHDPALRCEGTTRHNYRSFAKVATMPFVPNALFGFFKSDRAFHGVEPIEAPGVERNALLYNIYVRKAVRMIPAAEAGRLQGG